ncbi:MAG TPA: hypothetical protein VGR90_04220, partial [Acidimicrobiales bacterium]|nr:hypothetical protein [Acidimicrobiales bacterium]
MAKRPGPQVIPRPAGARPGAGPPWPPRPEPITLDEVKEAFARYGPPGQRPFGLERTVRDGAVLRTTAPAAVL